MNATFLTLAIAQFERGRVKRGLWYLNHVKYKRHMRAVVAAMKAYASLALGEQGAAETYIKTCKNFVDVTTDEGKYVDVYCNYLLAILYENKELYTSSWSMLQSLPCSENVKEALILHRLATEKDVKGF